MPIILPERYSSVTCLFQPLSAYHLSVKAVLQHDAPGEVWVDDAAAPEVGLIRSSEGYFLAGNPNQSRGFAELKEHLPFHAYLYAEPADWLSALPQFFGNRAARAHARQHYLFAEQRIPHYQSLIPEGFTLRRVDADLLAQTVLKNYGQMEDWVEGWGASEDFLRRGLGFCLLHGETIASMCLLDCATGDECEMGIFTDPQFRRKGLATIVVAAAVDECLKRGLRRIGWQCLRSNRGSIGVAKKVGFKLERDYTAYSGFLPAENPGDLDFAEAENWARHYEQVGAGTPDIYSFFAAEAWTLAGNSARALELLSKLLAGGWTGRLEWWENSWCLNALRAEPEFQLMMQELRAKLGNKE